MDEGGGRKEELSDSTRNQKPETRNQEPETRNQEPGTRNPFNMAQHTLRLYFMTAL
jgi:hypothetical protein